MRRPTSVALALGLAATAFAGVAADVDPASLVDCTPEDGVTFVVEGEPHEQVIMGAPLTLPIGDAGWSDPADEPTGGATYTLARVNEFYAMNHVDGQRATVSMTISWDGVGDIDIDVFDADGEIVGDGHNFNTYGADTFETASWSPEPCATYDVAITNNLSQPAQNITITTEVTSKAPRKR